MQNKEPKYILNDGDHHESIKCPVCGYKRRVVNGNDEGCPAMCEQRGEQNNDGALYLGEMKGGEV